MGGGFYSSVDYSTRAVKAGYGTKSTHEVFTQKTINSSMNPFGVKVRESRDSEEHPNSLAIILALDVTGSMGSIPHNLIANGLPTIMDGIIKDGGIKDPQVLFLGIGDHECDTFPLQTGQFESSDKLLEKWLKDLYLEGGGGGNGGESYLLAWYFASKHTSIDCFEKRSQKGFLFTIGDEPVLKSIPKETIKGIMGGQEYSKLSANELLEEARKTYNVYHIHVKSTASGSREYVAQGWKELMGDYLLTVDRHEEISSLIANTVNKNVNVKTSTITNNNEGTTVIL
jgi:hypothetical protein